MNERNIRKIKLTEEQHLNVEYIELTGEDSAEEPVSREGAHEVHQDLIDKLDALKIHLATICEQGQYTEFEEDLTKLEIFHVTGITFGGSDEHEGVSLIGRRVLKTGKVLNLVQFVKLHSAHSDYSYVLSLNEIVRALQIEADEYLNGKYAPTRQLNLFDNKEQENDGEENEDEEEVKPKKGRSRKLKQEVA